MAKFFAHLLYQDAIGWHALSVIKLTEEDTTSSNWILVKVLFMELNEHLGAVKLVSKLSSPDVEPYMNGLFPVDNVNNAKFSTNFFTSFGLGMLTDRMWEFIDNAPKILLE